MEKRRTIINPTQKVGRLNPKTDPPMMLLLRMDFGYTPAHNPRGIPKSVAITIAMMASSKVAGSLWMINLRAGML
jgi:hypothetical protein